VTLRRRIAFLGAIGAVLLAPFAVPLTDDRALGPVGLSHPIGDFGSVLASQLDQPPLTGARFVGMETGPDRLIVLFFELRPYPYLGGRLAFLASRCVPPDRLDPWGMSGGFIDGDPATDSELAYLRSDAQPRCPNS